MRINHDSVWCSIEKDMIIFNITVTSDMKTMIQKEMDRNEHYIAANDYFKNIFTSIVSLSFACEILIRSIVNQFRDPKLLQTKIFRENININFYIVGKNIHYFFFTHAPLFGYTSHN